MPGPNGPAGEISYDSSDSPSPSGSSEPPSTSNAVTSATQFSPTATSASRHTAIGGRFDSMNTADSHVLPAPSVTMKVPEPSSSGSITVTEYSTTPSPGTKGSTVRTRLLLSAASSTKKIPASTSI